MKLKMREVVTQLGGETHCNIVAMSLNAVAVTVSLDKCDIEGAMSRVLKRIVHAQQQCNHASQQLMSDPSNSSNVKTFVEDVRYIVGSNHLCLIAARYNQIFLNM